MEQKYKVWDKEQKKFLTIDDEDEGCAKPNYYQNLYFTLNGRIDEDGYPYQIDAEILPYTAVKDIKENESHLGHILKEPISEYTKEKDKKPFGIVKKERNSNNLYIEWNYVKKFEGEDCWLTNNLPLTHIDRYEIVGNIYTDPDMIKRE
jgi:hypothetical protein